MCAHVRKTNYFIHNIKYTSQDVSILRENTQPCFLQCVTNVSCYGRGRSGQPPANVGSEITIIFKIHIMPLKYYITINLLTPRTS